MDRTSSSTSNERILLIGVGAMGRPYLDELVLRGMRIRVVECEPCATALRNEGFDVVTSAGAAEEHFIAASLAAAADFQPTAVIPFAEPHVLAGAWIQRRLGLRGPGFDAALASRNKALQRLLLGQSGVKQPEFVVTTELSEAMRFREQHGPVVMKGLRGSGSRCVRLVATESELEEVMEVLNQTEPVLIEEFLPGPEYSAELLVADGNTRFVNLTSKITSGAPEFVELGHVVPASAEQFVGVDIQSFLQTVVHGLGIHTSLVHLEFLVHDMTPYLIEVALRTPGDHILELIESAYEFSAYGAVIDLYTGQESAVGAGPVSVSAIHYLRPKPGVVAELGDVSLMAENSAVKRFDYPYRVGDFISPLRSSRDRLGYVIFTAETHAAAGQWSGIARALDPLTI